MQTMDKASERRLVDALGVVATAVNEGSHPSQAIAKAAQALDVPRGHLPLLVNAYNTGRTTRQRQDGESTVEKAAEFELANHDEVLQLLFPETPQTPARKEAAAGVHPEYQGPPTWIKAASHRVAPLRSMTLPVAVREQAPTDPWAPVKKAHADASRARREAEEVRREKSAALDRMRGALEDVEQAFRDPAGPTLADVRPAVEAYYGEDGAALIDHMTATRPGLAKRASRRRVGPVDWAASPWRQIKAAVSAGQQVLEVSTKEAMMGLADKAMGTLVFHGLTEGANNLIKDRADERAQKFLGKISTPEHEAEIQGIQDRAMLHDMTTDEVISGYDPAEFAKHFNRLSAFAPSGMRHSALAVPLLRKSLQQGHLDPFEGKEIVDTETRIRDMGHRQETRS